MATCPRRAFCHVEGGGGSFRLQRVAASSVARFSTGLTNLSSAGCRLVYLDGSFVTRKERPGDIDACWDVQYVDDTQLDPIFWDFSDGRAAQKHRFLSEFFPAQLPEGATGKAFVDFFQVNKSTGKPKGILAIRLRPKRRA